MEDCTKFFTGSTNLLQKILDTTQTMIFWKDAERRFVGANQAFLEYYDFAGEEDILGKTDEDMGWHSNPDPFQNDEIRVLRNGESTYMVHGKCMARGLERDILASKSPLYEQGKIVGLVGSFIDVTNYYRQQNEIGRLNRRLDAIPGGICIYQKHFEKSYCISVNKCFANLLGTVPETFIGKNVTELMQYVHPDDLRRCYLDGEALWKDKRHVVGTYRFRNLLTGKYVWLRAEGHRVRQVDDEEFAYYAYSNIDDLMQAKEKLAANRRIFEETIRAAKMIMWEYDIPNRRVIAAQDDFSRGDWQKFGLTEIIENVPESLVPYIEEEDVPRFLAMYAEVEAGRDASGDFWYKVNAGQEARCERIIYSVVKDASGRALKAYAIGRNITAEKKLEERYIHELSYLQHSNEYNLLGKSRSNLTQNKVHSYDSISGDTLSVSAGMDYDSLCQVLLDTVYQEEDRIPLHNLLDKEQVMQRYRQGETYSSLQYRRKQKSAAPIWVSTVLRSSVMPETGELECFIYTYDVSEKALEEQIIGKLAMLGYDELGLVYAKTGLWKCYRFKRASGNDTLWETNGNYDEDVARYVSEEVVPEDKERVNNGITLAAISKELAGQELFTFTNAVKDQDGKVHQKLFQFAYLDEKQDTIFYCMTDVTGQFVKEKERIAELQAAKLDADSANQAKSNFLSSMSHDLRTPLNGIIGFTDLALKAANDEAREDYLQKIKISSSLLMDLVNDTLELSRIESGKMVLKQEVVNGKAFWEEAVKALVPSATVKKIHLRADTATFPGEMIKLDTIKTKKILLNLISNAIKYTPEGGTVTVKIQVLNPPEHGCTRRIIIADTGIGMSQEFLPRIYEPFSQEMRPEMGNVTGTGLGLAIVKRIVDLMGGTIVVESKVDVGTRFTVDLPVEHGGKQTDLFNEQAERQQAKALETALQGKTILLCEDNYLNAEIAKLLLKDKKMQVDWARNGQEGVEKFRASMQGYYDLVLMDIRMPVLDGYEALAKLRQLDREDAKKIPVIAMTADAFEEDMQKAQAVGMAGYITKPINPSQMFATLVNALSNL